MYRLYESFEHALMITSFVFAMMILVDYLNVLTRGKMSSAIRGGLFRQYVVTSFLGATPGCLGAFMNVSFYVRGLITFGALAGGMIATSGDSAFVMLALFPKKALFLFALLFLTGIVGAFVIDRVVRTFKVRVSDCCHEEVLHKNEECRCSSLGEIFRQLKKISLARFLIIALLVTFLYLFAGGQIGTEEAWTRITFIIVIGVTLLIVLTVPDHYLEVHIWEHITKKHLWKIFLWSFSALLVVNFGIGSFNLVSFVESHMVWVLLISLVFGLIPDSGPHIIFVVMFAEGIIPFSVLFASSIVQDGHGILPLLSQSVKDSILLKSFNFIIGLIIGLILYWIGF